ncbi:ABC transporter permease [Desulfovibrio sp.]|uniref:MlaE family ABC transporter permease n=1 Tax=Desulfovibrio sp. TaxID=885 RepID=UPI0025BD6F60|nr:ABC transporter permease [Desulfovibrio sp.]
METSPQVTASVQGPLLRVSVGGSWNIDTDWPPEARTALESLTNQNIREVRLESDNLGAWDSSLLVFLVQLVQTANERKASLQTSLPDGLERLLKLAFAVPAKAGSDRKKENLSFVQRVGQAAIDLPPRVADFLNFVGDVTLAVGRLFVGRTQMRPQDLLAAMQECGVQALPIISITSMLFGLILAFVGAVQLTQFGAQIYVAGLVGIGMLRVMGAVMVGVVMAGRVGAAYAALIGTMQVNEEVDALATLGIAPVDFLVLPRVVALTAMIPLLTLYADLMGVVGGYIVATTMLNISPMEYINATMQMVPYKHVFIGLAYGTVFGVIIALTGCYQGMRCGRSAQAVGLATTTAVVHAIVGIIVATAVITVICNVLDI